MASHKDNKVFAIFDISSSSVAGAHVITKHSPSGLEASIIASAREDAVLKEDLDMKRFVTETVHNLEHIIARIQKADMHQPQHIEVILASPWYSSQTRTIFYKSSTPFTCTNKLINSLVDKEVEQILTNDSGRFGKYGSESIIVEKQLSLIKLNGYGTTSPAGKKATTLEVFLTITIAPKPILDQFTTILKRSYGTRTIGYTTSPYATFVVVRDEYAAEKECVIIDVGEEVTDVAFIKDGIFLYQHSFPVGTYALYRALIKQSAHTAIESRTLLESYRLAKLAPAIKQSVDQAIETFKSEWQSGLQSILDNGHYGFCMPSACYITADARFELLFTDIVKSDPFIQHTCSRGLVRPYFISSQMLDKKVRSIDGSPLDIPLATAAIFVERLL